MQNPDVLKWELAAVLDRLDEEKWERLEKLLANGEAGTMYAFLNMAPLGEDAARDLMEKASDIVHHGRSIMRHRIELHDMIDGALNGILMAQREIKTLDGLGDVEYEGGSADLEAFLNDAARSLRAAQALKSTGKDGNT